MKCFKIEMSPYPPTKDLFTSLDFPLCWMQHKFKDPQGIPWPVRSLFNDTGGREKRLKGSQSPCFTMKEVENWKRQGGGGLRLWCWLSLQRSFCPAMVTLKTTRPPNPCEWTQFKCRHPSPIVHKHTHIHAHFAPMSSCHFHVLTWVVGRSFKDLSACMG